MNLALMESRVIAATKPSDLEAQCGRLHRAMRRGLGWACVVATVLLAFFVAWWVIQDRPIRQMRAALIDGNWREVLRIALPYLAKHPEDAEAWKIAARCYGAMGQFSAVEACLAKAGDLDVIDLRLRADALMQLERTTQAADVLRELLRQGGNDPAVLQRLAILEFRRGLHEEAFTFARRFGESPEHAAAAWYIQATFHSAKQQYNDAIACLERALELNPEADRCGVPTDTVLWYVGACLHDVGRMQEAREYYRRALEHAQTAEIYWSLGEAEEGCGDVVAAEDAWRRALAIDPKHGDAMFALAKLALQQNRPEEAIDWLHLAQRSGKNGSAVETALSRAYARLGQTDRADEHARRAEALHAEADAKAQEERMIADYPRNFHSRMLLTRRAIDQGNIAEATALVDDALREQPDNPFLRQLREALANEH